MSEAMPPAGTPAPSQPQPDAGAPAPTEQPAKKGGGRRILSILVLVLLVGGGLAVRFILPAIEDSKWKEGACVDYLPTSFIETSADEADIVGCDDASAQAEIIAVFKDSTLSDAEARCPGNWIAAITRDTTLYCLAEH